METIIDDNIIKMSFIYDNTHYANEIDIRILDENILHNLVLILKSDYHIKQECNTIALTYTYANPYTSINKIATFILYNTTIGKCESLLLQKEFNKQIKKVLELVNSNKDDTTRIKEMVYNPLRNENSSSLTDLIYENTENINGQSDQLNEHVIFINDHHKNIKRIYKHMHIMKSKISRLFYLLYRDEHMHHSSYPDYDYDF